MGNIANIGPENKADVYAEMPDWMVEATMADAGMGVVPLSEFMDKRKAGAEHPKSIQGDLRHLPAALAPLIDLPHWVLWRWEKSKTKFTKVPYQPNGRKAKNNDPATWTSYNSVIAAVAKFDGIGFCLLGGNISAFDIDHCRDPNTGAIDAWATSLVQRTGSYSEITVSGTGLRIIGYGEGERLQRKFPVHDGVSIEVYRRAERYIVITGNPLPEAKDFINIDEQLDATVAELDVKKTKAHDEQQSTPKDGGLHARQINEEEDWDKFERIIRNGEPHGDAKGEFGGDRNRAVWWVICEMFRRGYSARTIVVTMLDRTNKISEHIYDQGNPRRYAEKQVKDAKKKITFSNDEGGKLHKTQANIRIAVLKMGVTLRYDQFADRTLIDGLPDFGPVLYDAACDRIWLLFDQRFKLHVSKDLTRTVILDTALLNRFHPVRDYLKLGCGTDN
jgi:hypothetical protein